MRRIKPHTSEKLDYFRKYVEAYLNATKKLPTKYYIDAFAGSGTCILCGKKCKSKGGIRCQQCGQGKIVDGSAIISTKTKNEFDGYLFIDLNGTYINELNNEVAKLDNTLRQKIKVIKDDSNVVLKSIYKHISQYTGCLVFLDLVGPELEWDTVMYLAKIHKIDLLILYPYDMSLVRLTKDFGNKLDSFYGDNTWSQLYHNNLDPKKRKIALLNFYVDNLKQLGLEYVVHKQIRRRIREGKPVYHLILASHNYVAKKIMDDIFDKEPDGQQKFKFQSPHQDTR